MNPPSLRVMVLQDCQTWSSLKSSAFPHLPPPFLVPCCVGGWAAVCCVLLGFLGSLATVVTSLCIYSLLVYFQDKAAAHLKYGGSFWFWSHVFIGEWIWWS